MKKALPKKQAGGSATSGSKRPTSNTKVGFATSGSKRPTSNTKVKQALEMKKYWNDILKHLKEKHPGQYDEKGYPVNPKWLTKQKGGSLSGGTRILTGSSEKPVIEKPATKKQVRQEKRKARPTRTDKKFNKAVRNHPLI